MKTRSKLTLLPRVEGCQSVSPQRRRERRGCGPFSAEQNSPRPLRLCGWILFQDATKRAEKEKRAEPSFEVRPLFRAYDRRELGLPSRALSRFGSIRLVDASTRASGVPRGSTQTISHKS